MKTSFASFKPEKMSRSEVKAKLDDFSLEEIIDMKIQRFFDRMDEFDPTDLHNLIISHVEKVLLVRVMKRTGGNQVRAAKILGINRNTLRRKLNMYELLVSKGGNHVRK